MEQKNKKGVTHGIQEKHAVRGKQLTKETKLQIIKGNIRYV